MLIFEEEGNRRTWRKTLGARARTNNKLNSHMTPVPGIETGTYSWEARALATTPPQLPKIRHTWKNAARIIPGKWVTLEKIGQTGKPYSYLQYREIYLYTQSHF